MTKNTQKRLFFTDPIKAAYMAREFNVEFEAKFGCSESGCSEFSKLTAKDFQINKNILSLYYRDVGNLLTPFYVTKKSESIFEPKDGDEGRCRCRLGAIYLRFNNLGEWVGQGSYHKKDVKIIMRDDKHYFSGEIENE